MLSEPAGTVGRELANLEEAGILSSHSVGNQKHYALREDNAILEDLRNIFLKMSGASEEIRIALSQMSGVEIAFIFGSYAEGRATTTSDLDLMIIGDIDDRTLSPEIAKIERKLGRPINYTTFPREEAESRLEIEGDFVNEVLKGSTLLLIGSADDPLFRTSE